MSLSSSVFPQAATAVAKPLATTRETLPTPPAPSKPSRVRFSRLWLVALGCLFVAGSVWFLPPVLAQTNLKHEVFRVLGLDMPPGTKIGTADLGWNKPITLENVEIPDEQGHPLFSLANMSLFHFDQALAGRFSHGSLYALLRLPPAPHPAAS